MEFFNTGTIYEIFHVWASGGWLMIPLFALTVYVYFSVLHLYFSLSRHFLIQAKCCEWRWDKQDDERTGEEAKVKEMIFWDAEDIEQVRRHFAEIRSEYLSIINRRIRFVSILITTGPLIGLLGTVTGMLSAFNGMIQIEGDKLENIVEGISEALITTQAGLMISIPAYVILSFIIQKRNRLEHEITCLEQHNIHYLLTDKKEFAFENASMERRTA